MTRRHTPGLSALPVAGLAVLTVLTGCEKPEWEPPDREAQVAAADVDFSMALFDTVSWESQEARRFEGNVVFATYCRNCHGTLGQGDTDYAASRDLDVPSLVEPEWRWAESPDSVLHRIYVGHARGMPTWGVAGITPREMDAVTAYLLEVLRPEVMQGEAGDG